MALTITKADVKRKLMIASGDTTYDSAIDSLIAEMQPALEYTIDSAYLSDTGNTGLQATLKLGVLEVICAEFLDQVLREMGASEEFTIAGLTVSERKERGVGLLQQGLERLAPYMKSHAPAGDMQIASSTSDEEPAMSEESVW